MPVRLKKPGRAKAVVKIRVVVTKFCVWRFQADYTSAIVCICLQKCVAKFVFAELGFFLTQAAVGTYLVIVVHSSS